MVRQLVTLLPDGYRAAPRVSLSAGFEVDVTAFDTGTRADDATAGGTATLPAFTPTLTVDADLAEQDEYEVRVYAPGRQLVAAVEIVSPSNKDRPDTRELFAGKVAALLRKGVCVSVVDVVSVRLANLYAELLARLDRSDPALGANPPPLYAVTLRTRQPPKRNRRPLLDAWYYPMAVGEPLPTVPLWLTEELRVMLPLEAGYEETCRILGIA
jgi:hypothetical protein